MAARKEETRPTVAAVGARGGLGGRRFLGHASTGRGADRDEIAAALAPSAVLDAFGVRYKRAGQWLRMRRCPACGERGRVDTVSVHTEHGGYIDHAKGCKGDVFALVAGLAGLDAQRQFPEVKSIAAEIAGVDPLDRAWEAPSAVQVAAQRDAQRRREAADTIAKRERGVAIAGPVWAGLASDGRALRCYLEARGVAALAGRADVVRCTPMGWPSVAQYTADERVVNVVTRRFPDALATPWDVLPDLRWPFVMREGAPKARGLTGCPTPGTMIGKLGDITAGRAVVVTEGVIDALTACLAWPGAVVLGANGAQNMPAIAAAAAPMVRQHGGRLVLVADAGEAGEQAGYLAARAALAAGLRLGADLAIVTLGDADDLNDAWCAGWRP